jgi:hypothetical protein
MTAPRSKNTSLRRALAAQLREMRALPPFKALSTNRQLRRPLVQRPLVTQTGPVSLSELVAQGRPHAQLQLRPKGLDSTGHDSLLVASPDAELQTALSTLYVAIHEPPALGGPSKPWLRLFCYERADDDQFWEHLRPLWRKYRMAALDSPETRAQYREFLRLKAIYEPSGDESL